MSSIDWVAEAWDIVEPDISDRRLSVPPGLRVYEIWGISDWIWLCKRYPQDVTEQYGRWWQQWGQGYTKIITPDWRSVASEWDAVHLSWIGLLTTEGIPLTLGDEQTMLEGWSTESTVWLRGWSTFDAP